jgi:hypothetical protein
MEMMKPVKGYEGLYSVDEEGNIFGWKWKHFLIPSPTGSGYPAVTLSKNNMEYSDQPHGALVSENHGSIFH